MQLFLFFSPCLFSAQTFKFIDACQSLRLIFLILAVSDDLLSQNLIKEPEPSDKPSAYQLAQIKENMECSFILASILFMMKNGRTAANLLLFIQTAHS